MASKTATLSSRQREELRRLAVDPNYGYHKSCTNSTLCALEKRGLAAWHMVESKYGTGARVELWWITDDGREALK